MTRIRAAAWHLAGTLVICAVCLLLLARWFPSPYFGAAGGLQLALLQTAVAVVAGPLLTLVIYKPGKRGLLFDLAFIALLQSAALAYGLHVSAGSRPVFLVAAVDRFELVSAREIADADLAQGSQARFRSRSWNGPVLVLAEPPTDTEEYNVLSLGAMSGRDLKNLPKYFLDYDAGASALLRRARTLDALYARNPGSRATITQWLNERRLDATNVVWLPVAARRNDLTMLMDKSTAATLGAVAVEPPTGR